MTKTLLDKVDACMEWSLSTPGACNGGRAIATDDPETLGWAVIHEHLEEDGVFVFRHIPVGDVPEIAAKVEAMNCALHSWRIFYGTADNIAANRTRKPTPPGFRIRTEQRPDRERVEMVSKFLSDRGLKPFIPRVLAGEIGRSVLVTAYDEDGQLAGVSFGHFPFTAPSIWEKTGWCGLVTIDETARGTGLGRAVNDASIDAMIDQFGAADIVEYAAEDNLASRRMIEGSGLRLREDILTCAATNGATPYTR